jgi:hypothetical protein
MVHGVGVKVDIIDSWRSVSIAITLPWPVEWDGRNLWPHLSACETIVLPVSDGTLQLDETLPLQRCWRTLD